MADTMIVTHIYLLMGCALPVTATYILLSGSVFPSDWTIWSLAGVVFLGIGDSAAAILGKKFGKSRWREMGAKTQEGSSYLVVSVSATYWVLCNIIEPNSTYLVSINLKLFRFLNIF
jgi:dolichol kinase